MKTDFYKILDYYIPNPKCELDYNKDYELLIATVLSAQCTDKRVNLVTKDLFNKYPYIQWRMFLELVLHDGHKYIHLNRPLYYFVS